MLRAWRRFVLWFVSHVWAWVLVLFASIPGRKRMSHNNGVAARGTVRVVDRPEFPDHEFFQAGREWTCRVRHASVSYWDDAVIQVRSASIKFSDASYESPLDLELNTGTISLFWTAWNFLEFFVKKSRVDGIACDFVKFYRKYERGLVAAHSGIRKHPETFAQLYYHSQCAQRFVGRDGVLRYVKYRLVPEDRGPETGLMDPNELTPFWSEDPAPGETRGRHYLKRELEARLSRGPVGFHLQLQLHTPRPDDTPEIFNCNREWDDASHPWLELAHVTLLEALSFEQGNLMRFSLGHAPPSLGNLPAESLDDYNSVVYMRVKSGLAKSARLFSYKVFGMPKQLPDERTGTP